MRGKKFAKELMLDNNIPTAYARWFNTDQQKEAFAYLEDHGVPVVIKADGLTGGKGAVVCHTKKQAKTALTDCLIKKVFKEAGELVLIEDYIEDHYGIGHSEVSALAFVDVEGNRQAWLPSQDHKPLYDNNQGPNTGGMAAYTPVPWVTKDMIQEIDRIIFGPIITALANKGINYSGILYAGLKYTLEDGETVPKVVEFNARAGDPETQAILMLMKNDIVPPLLTIAEGGSISKMSNEWYNMHATSLVAASPGYPKDYEKGIEITIPEYIQTMNNLEVFHAGTRLRKDGQLVSNGGRILSVTTATSHGLGVTSTIALDVIEKNIIWSKQPHVRRDIGKNVTLVVGEKLNILG